LDFPAETVKDQEVLVCLDLRKALRFHILDSPSFSSLLYEEFPIYMLSSAKGGMQGGQEGLKGR
jgi:hypothetical protein